MTAKTISRVRFNLKHGKAGMFRMLKPGEEIMASDIIVEDCCYDFPSEQNVGAKADDKDTIIRLEFT